MLPTLRPLLIFALLLWAAPQLWGSSLALSMLSQMGALAIVCLSYNLLWGQGGMLSFGHAVYTGLGAFAAVHGMNAASAGALPVPLVFIPLVGGLAGLLGALVLGFVSTRKSGTPFAMITLGVGELVATAALMFPAVFGGEGGITANRVYGAPWWGWSFGPAIEVYALIAVYCWVCTAALWALTHTPLGRMLNAVRDNPERVAFVGYDPQQVRYRAFVIAGFFAGIGGALGAIHFEIVTSADSLGMARSGSYLLFTLLGGSAFFFGPVMGAVLLVLSSVLFSALSQAWLLYLGLIFLAMVLYAPGGVASVAAAQWQGLRQRGLRCVLALWPAYAALAATAALALLGFVLLVEMLYHRQLHAALGLQMAFGGGHIDVGSASSWVGAALLCATGAGLFVLCRGVFARQTGEGRHAG